jgi:hypothetical protein
VKVRGEVQNNIDNEDEKKVKEGSKGRRTGRVPRLERTCSIVQ